MTVSRELLRNHMVSVAIVAACPVITWLALAQQARWPLYAVVGVAGVTVGAYIGLRHPMWLFWALAAVLGGLPFGYVPGVHLPLYLLFASAALLAVVMHPRERTGFSTLEKAVILLIVACAASVIATGRTLTDYTEFVKWAVCTLAVVVLLRLPREHMARFGRIFVYAATLNALLGIAIVTVDHQQRLLKLFKPFGYGGGEGLRGDAALYVYTPTGTTIDKSLRLGGTWVLPNTAGIALMAALMLGIVLLRGWLRGWVAAILIIAILLTLSRSAIFSVVAGIVLVLVFHSMRSRDRQSALAVIGIAILVALATPAIRKRVFSSFGSNDFGANARGDALANFPGQMSGHWLFGLGWGRPEFKSGSVAQTLNIVANAPLLTTYRSGVIAGLMLVAVIVIGCIIGYRALRSDSLAIALYGGIFIGLCVVGLQLDKPVVDIQPLTLTFSVVLAFLVFVDPASHSPTDVDATDVDSQPENRLRSASDATERDPVAR